MIRWFKDPLTTRLYEHLLIIANHKDTFYRGIEVKRGQVYSGRKQLAFDTGISEQSIRTSINRLKSTNHLTIQSTSQYSIITLKNYNKYQSSNQQTNQQLTSDQPSTNHQLTTSNNDNNDKNDKKQYIYSDEFMIFWKLYPADRRNNKRKCSDIYKQLNIEQKKQIFTALQNYKQSEKYKAGFIQNSDVWFKDWETWLDWEKQNKYEGRSLI